MYDTRTIDSNSQYKYIALKTISSIIQELNTKPLDQQIIDKLKVGNLIKIDF
jgi:hypothetical protein